MVRIRHGDGSSVGSEVEAVTDRMQITVWEAPARCEVRHLGRVVRGTGIFAVAARARGGATFEWTEQLEVPLGALGELGATPFRPIFGWGLHRSLGRFAGFCQNYRQ